MGTKNVHQPWPLALNVFRILFSLPGTALCLSALCTPTHFHTDPFCQKKLVFIPRTFACILLSCHDQDTTRKGNIVLMSASERVRLNVGGVRFETTLTTIRRIPDSMLAIMFSERHTVNKDDDGFVFIDRGPRHFEDILNFLRTGSVPIGTPDPGFEAELEYYGLHQAFLDAGGQEILDPDMTSPVSEYLLLTISASMHLLTDERVLVVITGPSTVHATLTKLQHMLSGASSFGLRWEQNGCALRGTYTLNPAYTYNRQDGMDDLIIYLLQLISNGDFGSDFGFELVTSNSNGTILSGPNGPDGKFEHRSVFRRLLPWHKHTGIPHSRLARKRKADEMAAGSRQVES